MEHHRFRTGEVEFGHAGAVGRPYGGCTGVGRRQLAFERGGDADACCGAVGGHAIYRVGGIEGGRAVGVAAHVGDSGHGPGGGGIGDFSESEGLCVEVDCHAPHGVARCHAVGEIACVGGCAEHFGLGNGVGIGVIYLELVDVGHALGCGGESELVLDVGHHVVADNHHRLYVGGIGGGAHLVAVVVVVYKAEVGEHIEAVFAEGHVLYRGGCGHYGVGNVGEVYDFAVVVNLVHVSGGVAHQQVVCHRVVEDVGNRHVVEPVRGVKLSALLGVFVEVEQ